ncbi:MAG: hypothetical protein JWN49_221 [Parcubacteria group bacterium]|nr:hypothetical protein [Parcubacteria group bacterium]
MAIQITCITKPQGHFDHSAIIGFGWKDESTGQTSWISRVDLWQWLTDSKSNMVYTKDVYGNKAYAYPRTNERGTCYVQTAADGTYSDNLLYLNECA